MALEQQDLLFPHSITTLAETHGKTTVKAQGAVKGGAALRSQLWV